MTITRVSSRSDIGESPFGPSHRKQFFMQPDLSGFDQALGLVHKLLDVRHCQVSLECLSVCELLGEREIPGIFDLLVELVADAAAFFASGLQKPVQQPEQFASLPAFALKWATTTSSLSTLLTS